VDFQSSNSKRGTVSKKRTAFQTSKRGGQDRVKWQRIKDRKRLPTGGEVRELKEGKKRVVTRVIVWGVYTSKGVGKGTSIGEEYRKEPKKK